MSDDQLALSALNSGVVVDYRMPGQAAIAQVSLCSVALRPIFAVNRAGT